MKHVGPNSEALVLLGDVLAAVRTYSELTERKRGAFYRKSAGFLHFHEDPAGLFADLKVAEAWERFRVSTPEEQSVLLARVEALLSVPRASHT